MSDWVVVANRRFSFTFTGRDGSQKTFEMDVGDHWETDSACELVHFVNGIPGPVREQREGLLREAERERGTAAAQGNPQPAAPPAPGAGDGEPDAPDDPAQQAAPSVTPDATIERRRTPGAGAPDPRTPAEQRHDPQDPASPDQIRDGALGRGATPADADEAVRRAERNDPPPGQPHPTHARPRTRAPTTGGDPVDLFLGAFTLTATDLEVPAPILPIRLVRRYCSGPPYFGPWGHGWDHSYNVYVRELADGGVALWTGELAEHVFAPIGPGFEPPRGVHERLERLPAPASGYTATARGGLVRRFERPAGWTDAERIPLVELRDRHGNAILLTYDAQDRLARVDDLDGRGLRFLYRGCGLLERVEDHTGRRVDYAHHAELEHLVAVTGPATRDFPAGATTRYEYDERADHPTRRHDLLRVLDPQGRTLVENEYEDDPGKWGWNRVVRQIGGDYIHQYEHEQIQFVPAHDAFVDLPASRCTMRSPDGGVHVFTFNFRGDLLDHRFRLVADGSFRVVARQLRRDAQGNLIEETDPEGGRTRSTFDAASPDPCARGNLLEVERFAPPACMTPSRVITRATYEPRFQLPATVAGETGHGLRYVYDLDVAPGPASTGRLVRIELPDATLPDGTIQVSAVELTANARGQTTSVRSPEGRVTELHYLVDGALAGLTERVVRDPGGLAEETRFDHDARGYLLRRTAPGGRVTETRRNALGLIEELVPPAISGTAEPTRYAYDHDGRLVRVERPRGSYRDPVLASRAIVDEQEWNLLGHLRRQTLGANTIAPRHFRYQTCHGRRISAVDPMQLRTEYEHDERGLQLRETVGVGTAAPLEHCHVYDRVGRLVRYTGPGGQVHATEYDPWGRPARLTAPSGSVTHLTWGPGDRLLELRIEGDPGDGTPPRVLQRERYDHDERGRRVAVRTAAFRFDPAAAVEEVERTTYDGDDLVVAQESPRGAVRRYARDGLGRLVETRDALGNLEARSYDAAGELERIETTELAALGPVTRAEIFTHDARGRLTSTRTPSGAVTAYAYDDRDLVVARHEPLGVHHAFFPGFLGEAVREIRDTTGLALTTERTFDLLGRELSYRDPAGHLTSWERDALGRPIAMRLPDGTSWRWRYDTGSRVVEEAAPSGTRLRYAYDPASGLIASMTCFPGAGAVAVPQHRFRHDALGRLVEASLPALTVRRRYDGQGRLVEETAPGGTVARFIDAAGATELVYPDGRRERLERDVHGRPLRLTLAAPGALGGVAGSVLAELQYEGIARLARVVLGNGVTVRLVYDLDRRPVRIEHATAADLIELVRYRYDARGRRRLTLLAGAPGQNLLASMDSGDRLVDARWGFPFVPRADPMTQAEHDADLAAAVAASGAATASETYALDDSDSRMSVARTGTGAPFTIYVSSSVHRLISAGAEAFTYHPDGSLVADVLRTYDVDALGRPVRVRDVLGGGVLARFEYDALGRRRAIARGGAVAVRHFLDGSWIQEDEAGAVRQRTLHPIWDIPLEQRSAAGARVLHHDAAFSIAAASDASGAVAGRFRYLPFGEPRTFDPAGAPMPVLSLGVAPEFGAASWIDEIALYEMATRLYDPRHGVLLARDPFLYANGPNPYVYAGHNPFDRIDPEGDLRWFAGGAVALGARVVGGSNAVRQGIQPAEGLRGSEVGWSTLGAAVLAPAVVFAPEVTIPVLAGSGPPSAAPDRSGRDDPARRGQRPWRPGRAAGRC